MAPGDATLEGRRVLICRWPRLYRVAQCHPAVSSSLHSAPSSLSPSRPLPRRRPPTQLRWVAPDGRLMVRCEGPEAAQAERSAGLTRQALSGAKGAAEQWLKDLINLAALY